MKNVDRRRASLRLIASLLLFFAFHHAVSANEIFISVRGTVTSGSDQQPLQGVSVTVFDIAGKKIAHRYIRSMSNGETIVVPLLHTSAAGTHFIEIKSGNERKTKQVLLMK